MPAIKKGASADASTAERPMPASLVGVSSSRKDGLPKVHWKPPEHALMADALILMLEGGKPLKLAILNAVQRRVLPIQRQRRLKSMRQQQWLQPALDAAHVRREAAVAMQQAESARVAAEVEIAEQARRARVAAIQAAQEAASASVAPYFT